MSLRSSVVILFALSVSIRVDASESDQFITWGIELEDGSEAFNRYVNAEAELFLADINAKKKMHRLSADDVAREYLSYVFSGLLSSRLRKWFRESGELDDYPPRATVSVRRYQKMSVYRGRSFPYYLPMSRTVRLGDVYLGTDKVSHMFGFGRRYFKLYLKFTKQGMSDEEARVRVIRWGIAQEQTVVGKLVDGVMSYGDLEANYQGLRLALDLCRGENPYFIKENGQWRLSRPIDILGYVTPDLDESYNTPHYWGLRKRYVLPIYREEICAKYDSPEVRARFSVYETYPPSFFMVTLERILSEKKRNPKRKHSLEVICAECAETDDPLSTGSLAD